MIYTMDELRERITPVAKKYHLKAAYIFGSYARGEAKENSDVDILVDRTGSNIQGMFGIGGLYNDLSESIGKKIDLVTTQSLEQRSTKERIPTFVDAVNSEKVKIYE
jgi:predicted nucleotidyltransferase